MQPPILLPVWPIVTFVTQHGPLAHLLGPCDSPAFPLLLSYPCSGYLDLPVTSVKKLKSFESPQNRELQAVTAKASFTGLLWSLYSKIAQGSKQGQRSNDKHMKQFSPLWPDVFHGQKVSGLNEAVCITPLRVLLIALLGHWKASFPQHSVGRRRPSSQGSQQISMQPEFTQ